MTEKALQPVQKFGPQPTDGTQLLCMAPRGLAIFPVRYAVVPNSPIFDNVNLPGHMGNKFDTPLQHHKYALRQLREGFIYVYYHDHPDNKKWDIYQVREDGKLNELSFKLFKEGKVKSTCAGLTHFFIDKPAEQGKVDFAFSEHHWSAETLTLMDGDSAIRNKRMQTLLASEWVNNPSFPHGLTLTEDNLKQVFEFSEEYEAYNNFHPDMLKNKAISDDKGVHDASILELCSSSQPFKMSADEVEEIVQEINIAPNSTKNQPMILGLWDAVGVVRDLGGYAMDAAGWVNQYQEQWKLELNAIDNINIVKAALEAVTKDKNKALPDAVVSDDRMQHIQREEQGIIQKMQLLERGYRQQGIPDEHFATLNDDRYQMYRRNLNAMRKRKEEYAQQLQNNRKVNNERRVTASWEKYRTQIDETDMTNRAQYHQAIIDAVKPLVDKRIKDQVRWLESPFLLNALTEYHQSSLVDGHFFEDIMGDFFSCMNNCDAGEKKLEEWVTAAALTDDNLFWRAIAGNQTKGKDLLTPILAKIKSDNNVLLEHKTIIGIDKDIYDRLTGFVTLNADSLEAASEVMGQKVPTGGIDKIYSALGSRLITPLIKPGVDTVGNYVTRLLYSAKLRMDTTEIKEKQERRLKELDDIYTKRHADLNKELHKKSQNIQYARASRDRSIHDMLGVNQGSLAKGQNQLRFSMATEKRAYQHVQMSYSDVLEQITTDNQELMLKKQDVIASPGTAFSVLILAMQTASINQLLHIIETKGINLELAAKLTIAVTGIVATMAGVADNFTQKNSPWSHTLKKTGGRMMVVGGVFSAGLDFADAHKHSERGNVGLARVYFLKGGLNVAAAGFSTASLYAALNSSWEAAWAARLQKVVARDITTRLVLSRLLFTISVWVTLGIFAIDIALMVFSDDELEDWLQRTKLAKKPEGKAFSAVKDQQAAFENTINELFGITKPKRKDLDWEIRNDGRLIQMQRQEQLLVNKDNIYTPEHSAGNATDANITADTDYQFNRRELERVRTQIKERKQEIEADVKRYNNEQQQIHQQKYAAANP